LNRMPKILILSVVAISIVIVSAVCWHSVSEIHYLKSFYPHDFSVEDAFYASGVELIKVLIISIPFFFIVAVGLCLLLFRERRS